MHNLHDTPDEEPVQDEADERRRLYAELTAASNEKNLLEGSRRRFNAWYLLVFGTAPRPPAAKRAPTQDAQ